MQRAKVLVGIYGVLLLLSCSRRSLTGFFFRVDTGPVELNLREVYAPRESDGVERVNTSTASIGISKMMGLCGYRGSRGI